MRRALLDAALGYTEQSPQFKIFPAHPKTKRPLIKTGIDHAEFGEEARGLRTRRRAVGARQLCDEGEREGSLEERIGGRGYRLVSE